MKGEYDRNEGGDSADGAVLKWSNVHVMPQECSRSVELDQSFPVNPDSPCTDTPHVVLSVT